MPPNCLVSRSVTELLNATDHKTVVIVSRDLPQGLALNATGIVGISLGRLFPELVGPDVTDASAVEHPGITEHPLPVLKADPERLVAVAERARATAQVTVLTIPESAQRARTYAEYSAHLGSLTTPEQTLSAIGLVGPRAAITSLTGDLPLYR